MYLSAIVFVAATTILAEQTTETPSPLQVKVLSFNIRYGTANDGNNAWPRRQEMVCDVIRQEAADFCGLQESLRFQIDTIRQNVPEYAEHGCGRTDGKTEGEYSAILYRKDRWQLDRGQTVWLSDTPAQPGSASWGNEIPRIVTWGRFVEKETGRAVCVFNTHFDHRSQPSREKSAEFVAALIAKEAAGSPVVLTGDFNAGEQNPAIQRLKQEEGENALGLVDTFRAVHPDEKTVGTFNGFEGRTDGEKIDYIFTCRDAKVESAEILRTSRDSRHPSDHFPVSAVLAFPVK